MLKDLVERECRWHGYVNDDGTIEDDIAVAVNQRTVEKHCMEFRRIAGEMFLGHMRAVIDSGVGDGAVKIIETERKRVCRDKMGCAGKKAG